MSKRKGSRKPMKYPRKLRHTLERIRDPEAAQAADQDDDPLDKFPFRSFWSHFVPRGGVDFMHCRPDEELHRLDITYYLDKREQPAYVQVEPPWAIP